MMTWNEWDRKRFYRERTARAIDQGLGLSIAEENVLRSDASFRDAVNEIVSRLREERRGKKIEKLKDVWTLQNGLPVLVKARMEDRAWEEEHEDALARSDPGLIVVDAVRSTSRERVTSRDEARILRVSRLR